MEVEDVSILAGKLHPNPTSKTVIKAMMVRRRITAALLIGGI